MSYPRGADVGVAGSGGSVGSASLVSTLGTYVTSNSFSAFRASLTLDTLVNVTISATLSTGQVLKWDGTKWTNDTDLTGGGGGSVGSASLISLLGGYVTSNSMSARLLTFVTSSSLLTALGPYLTSASANLGTYVTSGSLVTALTPYLTSASAALSTYVTSGSLNTALTPYLTSSSANLATYLTSNSFSAWAASLTLDRLVDVSLSAVSDGQVLKWSTAAGQWLNQADSTSGGGSLTFTGEALSISNTISFSATVHITTGINALGNSRVSGTLSVGAFQINGRPAGAVMLASASGDTQAGNGAMNFSGSWSDIGVFVIDCGWRQLGNSGTMSVNVYTDGGTTPFLSIAAMNTASATTNIAQIKVFGGGGAWYLKVEYINNTNATKIRATSTLNTGIVNCIRVGIANVTATASNIAAFLTGFRKA